MQIMLWLRYLVFVFNCFVCCQKIYLYLFVVDTAQVRARHVPGGAPGGAPPTSLHGERVGRRARGNA